MKYRTDLENRLFSIEVGVVTALITIATGIVVWIFRRKKK